VLLRLRLLLLRLLRLLLLLHGRLLQHLHRRLHRLLLLLLLLLHDGRRLLHEAARPRVHALHRHVCLLLRQRRLIDCGAWHSCGMRKRQGGKQAGRQQRHFDGGPG
jgi:hypothetical protein